MYPGLATSGKGKSGPRIRGIVLATALPHGYDTPIGDHGVRLSGGQRQRVALARALLKEPPILILDEATAMFDPQGEIEFLAAARDAMAHRTVLLITHRPASLAVADRIVRMEDGRMLPGASAPSCSIIGEPPTTRAAPPLHP